MNEILKTLFIFYLNNFDSGFYNKKGGVVDKFKYQQINYA